MSKPILYHYTSIEGLLDIIGSNKMLARSSAWWDFTRVSFSTSDSLWVHGEWRIVFNSNLYDIASIQQFDYEKMTGQYAYEEEWYSIADIDNIVNAIAYVDNAYEYISFEVKGVFCGREVNDLLQLSRLVEKYDLCGRYKPMWNSFAEFCIRNLGRIFGDVRVIIDNEEVSTVNNEVSEVRD